MNNNQASIMTGFNKLDEITGGFFPSELTFIGSAASIGKSSFMLDIIKNICSSKSGKPLLFSIEMPETTIRNRLISKVSEISMKDIRLGTFNEESSMQEAENTVNSFSLVIDDTPDLRIDDLVTKANKYVQEEGCNIIFIDYIGLIRTFKDEAPVYEQISGITKVLKILARKLKVPVVCLGQVVRDAEGNEPNLNHIRGSGSIEQEADVILLLHRNHTGEKNIQRGKILVAKNHNGDLGSVDVDFYANICSFRENQREYKNLKTSRKDRA